MTMCRQSILCRLRDEHNGECDKESKLNCDDIVAKADDLTARLKAKHAEILAMHREQADEIVADYDAIHVCTDESRYRINQWIHWYIICDVGVSVTTSHILRLDDGKVHVFADNTLDIRQLGANIKQARLVRAKKGWFKPSQKYTAAGIRLKYPTGAE